MQPIPIEAIKTNLAQLEAAYAEQLAALVERNNAQPVEVSHRRATTYGRVAEMLENGAPIKAVIAGVPPAALHDYVNFASVLSLLLHIERIKKHIADAEAAAQPQTTKE